MIICPKCMQSKFTQPLGDTHYICVKNLSLTETEENGCGTQFKVVEDNIIKFPHNLIYMNRSNGEFFRKPLIESKLYIK
jgi:hypothetical protein